MKTNLVTFQIESFHGSDRIASAINVDGTLFGVTRNGDYGRIEIEQSGKCSFVLLSTSKHVSGYLPTPRVVPQLKLESTKTAQ